MFLAIDIKFNLIKCYSFIPNTLVICNSHIGGKFSIFNINLSVEMHFYQEFLYKFDKHEIKELCYRENYLKNNKTAIWNIPHSRGSGKLKEII